MCCFVLHRTAIATAVRPTSHRTAHVARFCRGHPAQMGWIDGTTATYIAHCSRHRSVVHHVVPSPHVHSRLLELGRGTLQTAAAGYKYFVSHFDQCVYVKVPHTLGCSVETRSFEYVGVSRFERYRYVGHINGVSFVPFQSVRDPPPLLLFVLALSGWAERRGPPSRTREITPVGPGTPVALSAVLLPSGRRSACLIPLPRHQPVQIASLSDSSG